MTTEPTTTEPEPTEPEPVRRRPLLAIPGWLLFGCLFLPTLRVCGDPMMPIQFPPSYAVYLGGMLIALLGGARLMRSRRRAFSLLLSLWPLTVFTILTLWLGSEMAIIGFVFAAALLLVQIKLMSGMFRTVWSDTAIGIGCLVHGVIAAGWSALMAFDHDGMWGAFVALGAAVVIVVASSLWIAQTRDELARKRRETEPAPLPQARAIARD